MTSALGVYCDTLIETEFIVLDSLMVFIDSLCHSTGTDGYIGIHPSGGLPPYQYQWSNGVMDSNYIDNLSPGIYTVTITDSNNCSRVMDISCDIATELSQ
ncbi:MAG: SprB repeat-containing protein [Saprospiraceae bacterium]|nr:SprB repeat-containing protein [Saprospiraceae bacterium]